MPTIHKALKENGSPAPRFNTDDDRTFFKVELFIHPEFKRVELIEVELLNVVWNLKGIDALVNSLLERTGVNRGIAGGIVEDDESSVDLASNQVVTATEGIDTDTKRGIADRVIKVLEMATKASGRKDILTKLELANNANNFETYIQPLVAHNWLKMTVPEKPTALSNSTLPRLKEDLSWRF